MPWDYTNTAYGKQAKTDIVWRLERLINYGLPPGEKLEREMLTQYLPQLRIPEDRRAFLTLLLWNKLFSDEELKSFFAEQAKKLGKEIIT